MKKILFFWLLLSSWSLLGQSYISAGGVRLGTGIGFTFQQAVERHTTIEGILASSLRNDQVEITILGERHMPILSRRFNMYTGAGISKAWNVPSGTELVNPLGLGFILGVEMTIHKTIISYDFKPAFHFKGDKAFDFQTGLSIRYVFKRKTIREQVKENHQRRKKKRVKTREKRKKDRNRKSNKSTKKKINWRFWEQ